MEIINRIPRMVSTARELRNDGSRVGLVPTSGALHEGHLSLMTRAREHCDCVIVSILQDPDSSKSNIDLPRDAELAFTRGVDLIFAPAQEDMFGKGFATFVNVKGLTGRLEAAMVPFKYRYVTTVVNKLLNIVRPDFAFFGRKDAQQAILVKRMVRELAMDVEIVVCPTVREEDGLALSSSNAYLSTDERKAATILRRALDRCMALYSGGERDTNRLISNMRAVLEAEPLARIDYVAITDTELMNPLDTIPANDSALVLVAAYIGKTRLTDNILINGNL